MRADLYNPLCINIDLFTRSVLCLSTSFPCANFSLSGSFIKPVSCNCFCSCEETISVFSKYMQITEEGIFISGEWEICCRNRDTNVDSYHTAICLHSEFTAIISALCKDTGTICKRVGIHDLNSFLIILHTFDTGNRSEDLTISNCHFRCYMIKNRWSYEESVLISWNCYITSVKNKFCTLMNSFLDLVSDFLFMTCIYNRAKICFFIVSTSQFHSLSFFLKK